MPHAPRERSVLTVPPALVAAAGRRPGTAQGEATPSGPSLRAAEGCHLRAPEALTGQLWRRRLGSGLQLLTRFLLTHPKLRAPAFRACPVPRWAGLGGEAGVEVGGGGCSQASIHGAQCPHRLLGLVPGARPTCHSVPFASEVPAEGPGASGVFPSDTEGPTASCGAEGAWAAPPGPGFCSPHGGPSHTPPGWGGCGCHGCSGPWA